MSTRTNATKGKGGAKPRARVSKDANVKQRSREQVKAVCEKVLDLMHNGKSTAKACEELKLSWRVFMDWVERDEENAQRYAGARTRLLERMAEEIHQIADTPVEGVIVTTKADGGIEEKRADMLEHRRLQIESRKWLLARLMPKKYGDRQHVEHSGRLGLESLVAGDDGKPDKG